VPGPPQDAPVPPDTLLYRLIPTDQCDPVDGAWEFRSAAFDNSSLPGYENEMSVVLEDTLAAHDRVPEDLPERGYPGDPRWGVAKLLAQCVVDVPGQTTHRTPIEAEPAHGDVRGAKNSRRRKRLKKCAEWVIPPAAPATAP
jgi:hypothetical protein